MKKRTHRTMTIPNWLTMGRILFIPVFVVVFYWPFPGHQWISAALFALGALTDWLDGFLARHLKQVSALGRFLDPVADKLMVVTALVVLVGHYHDIYLTLPAVMMVGREIIVSALREWMAELGERMHVAVSFIGKIKTLTQMVALLLFLILTPTVCTPIHWLAYGLLYSSVALSVWSMCIYLLAARRALQRKHAKS